ncbi:MAG: hypothetical protein PVF14_14235, partial [Desulfobacterales bacterium]
HSTNNKLTHCQDFLRVFNLTQQPLFQYTKSPATFKRQLGFLFKTFRVMSSLPRKGYRFF